MTWHLRQVELWNLRLSVRWDVSFHPANNNMCTNIVYEFLFKYLNSFLTQLDLKIENFVTLLSYLFSLPCLTCSSFFIFLFAFYSIKFQTFFFSHFQFHFKLKRLAFLLVHFLFFIIFSCLMKFKYTLFSHSWISWTTSKL